MIPTDELRELLADHDNGRRENETYGAYEDRLFNAILRLENLAPSLAAEVLRLREMVEGMGNVCRTVLDGLNDRIDYANEHGPDSKGCPACRERVG